jgi:hypothetical protein
MYNVIDEVLITKCNCICVDIVVFPPTHLKKSLLPPLENEKSLIKTCVYNPQQLSMHQVPNNKDTYKLTEPPKKHTFVLI